MFNFIMKRSSASKKSEMRKQSPENSPKLNRNILENNLPKH